MLSQSIDIIDGQLDIIRKKWGYAESVQEKVGVYLSNGDFKDVTNFDRYSSVSYWIIDGQVGVEDTEDEYSCQKAKMFSYPLKMVYHGKREHLDKDIKCGVDEMANMIIARMPERFTRAQRNDLGVANVYVNIVGWEQLETPKTKWVRLEFEIDLEITKNCINDNC